jgi:hypothetical protein
MQAGEMRAELRRRLDALILNEPQNPCVSLLHFSSKCKPPSDETRHSNLGNANDPSIQCSQIYSSIRLRWLDAGKPTPNLA